MIPQNLIDTTPLPKIPKAIMQSDVAGYIVDLWDSASSCKDNMRAIDDFLKTEQ